MENYQFDENFVNQGWSAMKPILDKEMPEKKKKRFGFFWISAVSGIAATVLVSWFALSYNSFFVKNDYKNNSITSENKENKMEENTSKEVLPLSKNSFNNIAKEVYSQQKNKGITNNFSQEKYIQNTDYQNSTILKNENTVIINEKINSTDIQKSNTIGAVKREDITVALIENNKKFGAVNSQKNEKQLDLAYLKTAVKAKRNYQIGIFAGMDRAFTNVNAGSEFLGLKYAKRSKKNLFELSFFYQNTQRFSPIYYQERLFSDPNPTGIASSTIIREVVYPWNCNCNGEYPLVSDEIKTYPSVFLAETTRQIGLGLGYGYRLNKRWELNGNLNATVNIGSPIYSVIPSEQSLGKSYSAAAEIKNMPGFATNDVYFSSYAELNKNLNAFQSKNGNKDLNTFKKYDIFGSFGASYYLYKNLKISLLRKQGFINLTPNDILNRKATSNGWQMQVTKYF